MVRSPLRPDRSWRLPANCPDPKRNTWRSLQNWRIENTAGSPNYKCLKTSFSLRWQGERRQEAGRKLALVTSLNPGQKYGVGKPLREAGQRRGYSVECFDRRTYPSGEALGRILYNRGIRGVFVGLVSEDSPALDLDWDLFSVVALSWPRHPCPFHSVATDMFAAVELAFYTEVPPKNRWIMSDNSFRLKAL